MPRSHIKKAEERSNSSGTHQLGNTLPSSEFSSISLKNSSTERPMLMGGSSRWLLVVPLIRRSYSRELNEQRHVEWKSSQNAHFRASWPTVHLHRPRCQTQAKTCLTIQDSFRQRSASAIYRLIHLPYDLKGPSQHHVLLLEQCMCQLMTWSATVYCTFVNDRIIPGVIWERTCVPSIPTQLKVECGNLLLIYMFGSL